MKISFLGAARTVTGSCYILETENHRFAVDCGMYQGNKEIEKRNRDDSNYDAKELDFILVTHAHIDHSGLLPMMVKHGFTGPIYVTTPTRDLLNIMLMDSAHIQEMEAEWQNRKNRRHGGIDSEPLYSKADAEKTVLQLKGVEYNNKFEPAPGVKVTFRDAGHILGSSFLRIEYVEDGKASSIVFSGDLGRPEQLIVNSPEEPLTPDYLILESTYGDRNHKDSANSLDELAEAIKYSYERGEKVVIPAFAVERSQQIIYCLFQLSKQGRLPKDMPVYLDSPLAIKATEIFRKHPKFFDDETQELISNGENPLDLPNLQFTLSADQSKAINANSGAAVIISASGMATAGRIKHHLRHNLWRPGASVVFVGYQAIGTPGRRIVNGAKKIRIFNEDIAVAAKIFTIGGFSGHAGQTEIIDWVKNFSKPSMNIILTHGEYNAQKVLAELIEKEVGIKPHIPDYLEELTLEPGEAMAPVLDLERARPRVDWEFLLGDAENLISEFRKRLEKVQEKTWVDQTDLRDRLLEINKSVIELISEL